MGIMEISSDDHYHQTLQNDQTHDLVIPYFSSQRSLQSVPSLACSNSQTSDDQHHHCPINSFTPHSVPVSSIAVSGDLVFTGSSNCEIGSWNSLGNDGFTFPAGNGAVKWLAVAGERLFSAHQDHKIRVWRIENHNDTLTKHCKSSSISSSNKSYRRVATLPTFGDRASKLLMPGNHVTIRRHKKSTWVNHVDAVSALALSPDKSLLYSVSWDRTLKVWRTADFRCLESVHNAHDDAINAVAASPDGYVYTGSTDKKIKVWRRSVEEKNGTNTNSRTSNTNSTGSIKHHLVASLEKHNSGINALAISADGSVLYSGASDRSVVVWEKVKDDEGSYNMVVLGALRGHNKAILCLAVVEDLVCSGSADKTVRVWRGVERSYSCLAVFQGHNGPVKCLTAVIEKSCQSDHDDDDDDEASYLVYSGGLDCEVKVWKVIVPNLLY